MSNGLDERIAAFWAWHLNVPVETILAPGTHLILGREDFPPPNRLVLYRSEWNTLIRLPQVLQPQIDTLPLQANPDRALTVEQVVAALSMLGASFAWRDYYYYQLPERITPRQRSGVRLLTADNAADAEALASLSAACSDWEQALAQITLDDALVAGCFEAGQLVGAASLLYFYDGWPVSDVGVLTHPEWRGRGIAAAVIALLARHSGGREEIMQYRTQEENIGSQRTAMKAGFVRWYVEEGVAIDPPGGTDASS